MKCNTHTHTYMYVLLARWNIHSCTHKWTVDSVTTHTCTRTELAIAVLHLTKSGQNCPLSGQKCPIPIPDNTYQLKKKKCRDNFKCCLLFRALTYIHVRTLRGWTISLVLFLSLLLPPPKNMSKTSLAECGWPLPPPSFRASSPPLLYSSLFFSSERISYARATCLNCSCCFGIITQNLLYMYNKLCHLNYLLAQSTKNFIKPNSKFLIYKPRTGRLVLNVHVVCTPALIQ